MSPNELTSEVTGRVWKVPAAPGDALQADEPLLIIESMKMEIPVAAERPCTVVEIRVSEGDLVEEGQVVALVNW
jgi:biotin carboxyl carrier protein